MMTDYFVDQSFPLFVYFILSIVAYMTRKHWKVYLTKKYSLGMESLGSQKTEEISFYQALTAKQRKMIVNQEVHNRRLLGFKKVDNAVIDKIKNGQSKKVNKNRLIGLSSYNILDNHVYQVAF